MTIVWTLVTDLRRALSPDTLVTEADDLPAYGQDFREQRGIQG